MANSTGNPYGYFYSNGPRLNKIPASSCPIHMQLFSLNTYLLTYL
jgi:hypothetical protein